MWTIAQRRRPSTIFLIAPHLWRRARSPPCTSPAQRTPGIAGPTWGRHQLPAPIATRRYSPPERVLDLRGEEMDAQIRRRCSAAVHAISADAHAKLGISKYCSRLSAITAPGAIDSATIRPFSSSLHRRRRTTPVISARRRTIFVSSLMSTIMCTRSAIPRESPACTPAARSTTCGRSTAYDCCRTRYHGPPSPR
jgi:hypothetical protein